MTKIADLTCSFRLNQVVCFSMRLSRSHDPSHGFDGLTLIIFYVHFLIDLFLKYRSSTLG
jgi:hypothetical protein